MNVLQLQAAHDRADCVAVLACPGSGKTTTLVGAINYAIEQGTDPAKIAAITYTNAAARVLKERIKHQLGHCGTLHGMCLKIMLKSNPQLKLLDEVEAERMLQVCAAEMGYKGTIKELSEARRNHWKKSLELGKFSLAERVVLFFHASLMKANLLEYDLLLASAFRRIQKGATFAEEYYVDEAQDWSDVDASIYHQMPKKRLFAVGDVDQAIFGFRGGRPEHFLQFFEQRASRHILPLNYRSSQNIVMAASALIQKNQDRVPFQMVTDHQPGPAPMAFFMPTVESHNAKIAQLAAAKLQIGSVAVLCRTNEDVATIKGALLNLGVPVEAKVYEGMPDMARVRTLLGLALDPGNEVLNKIEMEQRHSTMRIPFFQWPAATTVTGALEFLDQYHAPTADMKVLLSQIKEECPDDRPAEMFGYLRKNNYTPEEPGLVKVGTLHWSKGQEFDHVIIATADEPLDWDADEEERRLYYVAITRAKISISAVGSKTRYVSFSGMEDRNISPYIMEAGFTVVQTSQ